MTVALGTTAAWALAGRIITDDVGGFVTVHLSYILRLRDEDKGRGVSAIGR